jgi:hypothetical protein
MARSSVTIDTCSPIQMLNTRGEFPKFSVLVLSILFSTLSSLCKALEEGLEGGRASSGGNTAGLSVCQGVRLLDSKNCKAY